MDELDRIRAQVTKTKDDSYEMHRNTMRKELQEISKSRVKNWPNTMEAQRLKREEDRITKLEDEEVSKSLFRFRKSCWPFFRNSSHFCQNLNSITVADF